MELHDWLFATFWAGAIIFGLGYLVREVARARRAGEPLPPDRVISDGTWSIEAILARTGLAIAFFFGAMFAFDLLLALEDWGGVMEHLADPRRFTVLVGPPGLILVGAVIHGVTRSLRQYREALAEAPEDLVLATPCLGHRNPLRPPTGALLVTAAEVRRVHFEGASPVSIPVDEIAGTRIARTWPVLVGGMATLAIEKETGRESSWQVARVREVREMIERARLGEIEDRDGG